MQNHFKGDALLFFNVYKNDVSMAHYDLYKPMRINQIVT